MSSLRNLRDNNRFRGNLSYIVFTRHPLSRLRNPTEFDEFNEIMVANTCWVGPMVERDSRWIANQMAERLQANFNEIQTSLLIELTGGLPAFMKEACTALANEELDTKASPQAWTEHLVTRPFMERNWPGDLERL